MFYLLLSTTILLIGVLGIVLNRSSLIIMLMCMELVLLAAAVLFLFESVVLDNICGQMFAIMVLTVAAAESAMGLAMMVNYYSLSGTVSISALNLLSG